MPSTANRRRTIAAIAALAALGGAALGWKSFNPETTAPSVAYTLLDGRQANLDDLRGKVVLVNFWATTCTTCVREMPHIVETYEKFKSRGYETLAVAMSYDPPAYVANFAESRKLPFGVVIDNTGEIARRFGDVRLTPTTFLVDKRGRVVKRYVGEPDFKALHALVDQLLAET
jgi:peroxiredoxin